MIKLQIGDLIFMRYTNNPSSRFVDMVEDFQTLANGQVVANLNEWMLDESLNIVWVHLQIGNHTYRDPEVNKDLEVVEVWRKDGDVYRQVKEDNMISGQMTTDDLDDLLAENYR